MRKFINWLLGLAKPEPQQEPEQGKKFNNVSVDGLSAEKNVLQSIRSKTGASLKEIREHLWPKDGCRSWYYHNRPGDKQRYYDKETRNLMIGSCIDHFGYRMKKK